MKAPKDELVRIDAQGQAHAIGVVASQRLRAREGAYRMLPAPRHIVFMRLTGEDARVDREDGAIVRLAGEVTAPGALCDILAVLAQAGWRGELIVLDGEASRSVFFDQGNVVGVITNVAEERLGRVLYRYGLLDAEKFGAISEQVRQGRRFGDSAVALGYLSQEQVYQGISKQVEEVVCAALTVSDGTFFFLDGFDETRLASRHVVSANALLMDGVTRMDELAYFRQKIPTADFVPARTDNRRPPSSEFNRVYEAIDDKRNIEEIGRFTGLGEFETTKHTYALIQSKHVVIHPPRRAGGPTAIVATANGALHALFEAAEAQGVARELRDSLASFAVGAGVYEILFRGAGPGDLGTFDADRMAENAHLVSSGSDFELELRQMLHEYVSFALFSVGGALGADKEAELKRQVGPFLNQLSA
jgi:hypothetical protein